MALVARLDELCVNSNPVPFATNTSFQKKIRIGLAPDLGGILMRTLILHGSGAGDHAKALRVQPAELRDHLLRHTVSNVFLVRIVAQVQERQYHKHNFSSRSFASYKIKGSKKRNNSNQGSSAKPQPPTSAHPVVDNNFRRGKDQWSIRGWYNFRSAGSIRDRRSVWKGRNGLSIRALTPHLCYPIAVLN